MKSTALPPHISRWKSQLEAAELCFGVDPFILAAIIDRESLGGKALNPPTAGGTGDGGHGRGLGQIDDRYHRSFVDAMFDDGAFLWRDPTFNILYAARLLKRNLDASDGDYATAIAAYNCGLKRARYAAGASQGETRIAALNAVTTGRDYVTDVFARSTAFRGEGVAV
jgi:hypothetical protein